MRTNADLPILYSFRRCPYAMRARLAIASARQSVELREISLKNKHGAFLKVSSSGTVPCLVTDQGTLDESLDIMIWALERNDPDGWLDMPDAGGDLIALFDGPFKDALDRTKYAVRFEGSDPLAQREIAHGVLAELEASMGDWIFGSARLVDFAILPFVRQFANIDRAMFDAQPWPKVQAWLDRFMCSDAFVQIMDKHAFWDAEDAPIVFPKTV
jgi:glutathione S-transferase